MARIALVHDVAGVASIQAELLRSAGHQVDEIALPKFGASWSRAVKAAAMPARLAAYWPTARRLRRGKYDVIHVHWLTHGIVGVMARRPFFVQAHGSDLHQNLANPVYRWVTLRVLNSARKIFYVTPNLHRFLGDYASKLFYLPNPVDLRGVGQPFPAPVEVNRVLIFTRLDPVKGVDRIFPAVEELSRDAEVTALDWGPLAREYARRYGRWVHFAPRVPHAEIGAFLSEFDVVIGQMKLGILSLMEIESLAAGRPVITALDPDLYPDDPPPVLAAASPEAIVEGVRSLRAAPDRLAATSRVGRDWVLRNHSYARHLELLQAAYFGTPSGVR